MQHGDDLLAIPNTEYFINEYSEVFDSSRKRIDYKNKLGTQVVCIDWFDGTKEYPVVLLAVIAKYNIRLPISLFGEIEVLYKDKNPLNIFISNLYYRFKSLVEVPEKPNFYYIPYYTRYAINKEGVLFNLRKNKYHSWWIAQGVEKKNITGGYWIGRARRDIGHFGSITRHRALALTFKRYDEYPFDLVVNHLNGIPGDDRLDNIEWTTYSKNNKHAYDSGLVTKGVVNVLCKDLNKNTIVKFISIANAAAAHGLSFGAVKQRMKNSHRRYDDGLLFKIDDGNPWPALEDKVTNTPKIERVAARNIFTGKVYISDTADGLGKMLGIVPATILLAARKEKIHPHRGFNFRFIRDFNGWPNHHAKSLLIYKDHPTDPPLGYDLLDEEGNELRFFTSDTDAADSLGISKSSVGRRARLNLCIDGVRLRSFNPLDHLGPPIR